MASFELRLVSVSDDLVGRWLAAVVYLALWQFSFESLEIAATKKGGLWRACDKAGCKAYNNTAESEQMVALGGFFLEFIIRTPTPRADSSNQHPSDVILCHMPHVQ